MHRDIKMMVRYVRVIFFCFNIKYSMFFIDESMFFYDESVIHYAPHIAQNTLVY